MTDKRNKIDEIKRILRKTDESTYYCALREVYAEYGNLLVNAALRELEHEDESCGLGQQ